MVPSLALLICILVIAALFVLNREPEPVSRALWLPVIWIGIGASRMFSQWLGTHRAITTPDQYLEGSPLDRIILLAMVLVAVAVLVGRARRARTATLVLASWPVVLFLAYCALSTLWSDTPLVALKRWTKGFGNFAMVLVVLSDPAPARAIRQFFARIGFTLVPLSVILIKYYPEMGRSYDIFNGQVAHTGVAMDKNTLGCLCVIVGIASLWRLMTELHAPRPLTRRLTGPVLAHGVTFVLAMWLLWLADSATSRACMLLGTAILFLFGRWRADATPARPISIHLFLIGFGLLAWFSQTVLIEALGRDTTLTGRTDLWREVLALRASPLIGTGYESFFLGHRADTLWRLFWWHPNEAHNGYLEIYLTLGWIGVFLLALLLVTGYHQVIGAYRRNPAVGVLALAFFAAALVYNVTESAVKVMHPIWILLLLAVTASPAAAQARAEVPSRVPVRIRPLRERLPATRWQAGNAIVRRFPVAPGAAPSPGRWRRRQQASSWITVRKSEAICKWRRKRGTSSGPLFKLTGRTG